MQIESTEKKILRRRKCVRSGESGMEEGLMGITKKEDYRVRRRVIK